MGVNKVILLGNLGNDPEVIYLDSGKVMCTFKFATTEYHGDKKITEWHRIVCWDKYAEICVKILKKGSQVYIEGRLKTRSYETSKGEKKFSTEVVLSNLVKLRDSYKDVEPSTNSD